jgi:enoyl-CoA hydratase/carnithine racemase
MLTLLSCVFIAVGWVLLGDFRTASDRPKISLSGDRFGYYLAVFGYSYRLCSSPQVSRTTALALRWRRLILKTESFFGQRHPGPYCCSLRHSDL